MGKDSNNKHFSLLKKYFFLQNKAFYFFDFATNTTFMEFFMVRVGLLILNNSLPNDNICCTSCAPCLFDRECEMFTLNVSA